MPSIAENLFGFIGRKSVSFFKELHHAALLINSANSVPIIAVISLFVGIILALQAAYQLKKVGALIYVADLVGVSLTRELSPILTAIIVAGRSGSAFAAEIGSMKAAEEIDALVTMGINPVRFLVVPKLLALLIMLPALTIFSDFIGILGGFLLSITELGLHPYNYFQQTVNALVMTDVVTGLVKAVAFSVIITIVGAYQGFRVEGGAEEVGRRTTASVVTSIFLVIVFDLFFTTLFYFFA
jgi:phospholipid/cholesterol/gamma-HCH transport system permease protein